MVEDFDLDGGQSASHLSPNGSTTNPSSPVGGAAQQLQESANMAKSYARGRRNSFDWAVAQQGRQRSLSFASGLSTRARHRALASDELADEQDGTFSGGECDGLLPSVASSEVWDRQ